YDKLERYHQKSVYQEQRLTKKINALHLGSDKQITTLNEGISNFNKQLSMEKSTVSSLLLKQAQQKQQSLYNGKVLLEKHDPPDVYDSNKTLQLAQENRLKMKQLNKEIKPSNYTKINHLSGVFASQTAKSREELHFLNTYKTANVSKPISIPNEEFSDDTIRSVARKFLNEVKSTIVTLQHVFKQKMTLDIHNCSSSVHQEILKIVKDEIFSIVNQVDARLQNFEIQFLKEVAKFVRDFKSLTKKANESLAKHKALELEIEHFLRVIVSQDIMSVVQNNSIEDASNLQTELEQIFNPNENQNGNGNVVAAQAEGNTQLLIAQKEEAGIQLQAEKYDLMDAGDEIEEVNANSILMANLQQESTSSTQTNKAPVYDSDGSVENEWKVINLSSSTHQEIHKIFKDEIVPIVNQVDARVLPNVDNMNALSKPVTSNSAPPTREFTSVKNDRVISPGMFGINPSKTSRVVVPSKVVESNDLAYPVTSNSVPTTKESKVVENDKVIAHGMFRINPFKTSREGKFIPINQARASVMTKLVPSKVVESNDLAYPVTSNSVPTTKESKVVENDKFLGTVRFGNNHVVAILGFLDLQWGNILITRVYFVEGLGKNLFSVGQFCDLDLEVTFRRKTCFIRNLKGVDLLKGNRTTNLYTINLHDMASASPICLMARTTSTKSWLWHQRLSHLNFDTINNLAKNDLVTGLPKFKYHKEHLCLSREQGKSKRASHPLKLVPNSKQRLDLLHMDLCGPMRIASINRKWYVLVIVDDYSRYTWVQFFKSKDEAPEVIKTFLKRIIILLQSLVVIIRTDNGTEFKNQILKAYFDSVGISHQASSVRTPQQNRVVERRNQMLVEAARTMLIFSHAPLFLWAEAIATAFYTQSCSIIYRRFNKTPYELINDRKLDISFLHVFGALCYPKNDREDIRKLGTKGDIGIFIGYSADFYAYRVYNRRTKKIVETMNVTFDELSAMAFEQSSSKPGLQSMTSEQITMYDDYIAGQPSATLRTVLAAQAPQVLQTPTTTTTTANTAPTQLNTSSQATNFSNTSQDADELETQQQHAQQQGNQASL
nr:retrovirus-related Pol polyprotein from transposon TNT 1-94 [Tanacetum cinerariifolium]